MRFCFKWFTQSCDHKSQLCVKPPFCHKQRSTLPLVIQSASEESRGNETALYTRHFTSFRYREIATPNKSARNDNMENSKHALSFRAQAKNLVETKRHYMHVISHHSATARLPRRTSRLAMTIRRIPNMPCHSERKRRISWKRKGTICTSFHIIPLPRDCHAEQVGSQ